MSSESRLRAGEWVEVRSQEEILGTLDKLARLDELPFMPQMLQYCGRRFRVVKRAHKLCDTANSTGARQMPNAVLLEGVRCDGQAYGGCEMCCLIFWKEAWLKRVPAPAASEVATATPDRRDGSAAKPATLCSEAAVWAATRGPRETAGTDEPVYVCQATQMPHASRPLPMWDLRQYVEDCTSGNVRLSDLLASLLFVPYSWITDAGLGFGSALRWAYDVLQRLRGGTPYPCRPGGLPRGSRTPSLKLDLQVGEWVRVKGHREILATVDEDQKNRGMSFHGEMTPYCGKEFRVSKRVRRMINEQTGRMMELKNECLVLEGADCKGKYTKPLYCPRDCYPYWREIWLERAEPGEARRTDKPPAQDS